MKFDTIGTIYLLNRLVHWGDYETLELDDAYLEPILYIFKAEAWDEIATSEFRNWTLNTSRGEDGYYNAGATFGEEEW